MPIRGSTSFLIARFPQSAVKYPVGHAMIILDHADVRLLETAISKVTDEMCRNARAPEWCLHARARLASLVGRCLSLDDAMLAVSETVWRRGCP